MPTTPEDVADTIGLDGNHRRLRQGGLLLGALAVAGLIGWVWLGNGNGNTGPLYVTTAIERGGFEVIVSATGTVEPTNLVEVSSEVSGKLTEVFVDYNDIVEKGDMLGQVDTTTLDAELEFSKAQLDAALAQVSRARASLSEARQRYESARDLDERGFTTHETFLIRQAEFRRSLAEFEAALADQELARATVNLRQAELDKACICSPIRGVVLDRAVDEGQIVVAALEAPTLFTIAEDLTQMELQVDVDEADVGRVAVGQNATFVVDAYDDLTFPATISEIRFAPETIDGVVTYKAILSIDNTDLLLRPGMTATADIVVEEVTNALVVPSSALRFRPILEQEDTGGERSGLLGMIIPERTQAAFDPNAPKSLWLLRDGAPAEVFVTLGGTDGRQTAIRDGDVAEGDQVILEQVDG